MKRPFLAIALSCCLPSMTVWAQVVQLPTFRQFSVNTTVSVPDRGSVGLGGVSRSATGSVRRGAPILGRLPGAAPLFQGRAIGRNATSSNASIQATIIDHQEWDQAVLAEAARRRRIANGTQLTTGQQPTTPNAQVADPIESRARFLTANMGRTDDKSVGSQFITEIPGQPKRQNAATTGRRAVSQSKPKRRERPLILRAR